MSADWLLRPPSILAFIAALAEDTNTSISDLDGHINVLITAFNAFDNSCITPDSIMWRYVADETISSMHQHLSVFGPFGLFFAGTYLALELYHRYRKRDALEAHWEREKQRLHELHKKLEEYQVNLPEHLQEKFFKKIASIVLQYEKKLDAWRHIFEENEKAKKERKNQEMLAKIKAVQDQIDLLIGENGFYSKDQKLTKSLTTAKDELNTPEDVLQAQLTNRKDEKQPKALSPAVNLSNKAKAQKEAIDAELNDSFLTKFSSTFWFQVPFAWSWGYWFVFFFTMWGLATPFAAVPLTWGLLALIGPVLYLVYREYCAYQTQLVADESQLSEEQQEELSEITDPDEKQKKCLEMLKSIEKNSTQFRWGWLFVALIAAVSVSLFCGLAPVYALLLGIGVFLGVGLSAFGIGKFIDRRLEKKRQELKAEEEKLCKTFTLKFITEEKNEPIRLAAHNITDRTIILVGKGSDRTAYFADGGKFILNKRKDKDTNIDDKDKNLLTAKIKVAAFFSKEELESLENNCGLAPKSNQVDRDTDTERLIDIKNDKNPSENLTYRITRLALVNSGYLSQISSKEQAVKNKYKLKEAQLIAEYGLQKLAALKERMKKDAAMIAGLISSKTQLQNESSFDSAMQEEEKNISAWETEFENKCTNFDPNSLNETGVNKLLHYSSTHPRLEKYRRYLVGFVAFVGGYTLGCIIGFASTDFLSHIPVLSSVVSDGMVTPILIGAFSLLVAVSHMHRKGLEDEKHLAELEERRADPEYLRKQHKLEELDKEIKRLKESIDETMLHIQGKAYGDNPESAANYKNEIYQLINKPPKKWTIERVKKYALLIARGIFKVLTDVSSVVLIARALLTMGFSRALLPIFFASSVAVMNPLTTGVFSMFGAAFAANPLGITILVIAIVLLIIKAVVELYMVAQKEKELAKFDKVDLTLEKKLAKCEHLHRVNALLKHEKTLLPQAAPTERKPAATTSSLPKCLEKMFNPRVKSAKDKENTDTDDVVKVPIASGSNSV